MTQQKGSNTSGSQPYSKQTSSSLNQMSSDTSVSQIESNNLSTQTGVTLNRPQAGLIMNQTHSGTQQPSASNASQQQNHAQTMAHETGLEYTANTVRQEKLKSKNQKATDSLVDRMYWQHEESVSKSINVNDKGELEDYDDTPGFGSDKPGL